MPFGLRRVVATLVLCVTGSLAFTCVALATAPTITAISPNNGPDAGSTSVAITGTGFISGSKVMFGSTAATSVIHSSESTITATSPVGSGSELVNVTVTNSNGTSSSVPKDQFAYTSTPTSPWLGLNGNTTKFLGPVTLFSEHSIAYDRSFELTAGELPSELEKKVEIEEFEKRLKEDHEDGMIPVSLIVYKGYDRKGYVFLPDPEFPQERSKKEEEEGKNTIKGYVSGFVKSASAILKLVNERYPGMQVLFEPMNEPWGYTTPQYNGAEYANVIAKLLPEAKAAGIPLTSIYVGAEGRGCTTEPECTTDGWVPAMYAAQPTLETAILGWYFHPYGTPKGVEEYDTGGIQLLPQVQATMTSGQNNIIISEVGYCDEEINKEECIEKRDSGAGAQTGEWTTEMLHSALPYHEAGWLKALILYSRNAGGWAMQAYPSDELTKDGEALDAFANTYGQTWSIRSTPSPSGAKSSGLAGVSCTSPEACIAAGHYVNSSSVEVPIAERWNGKEWSVKEAKIPSGAKSSSLASVSCVSSEVCAAVGSYVNGSGVEVPLAERWSGTEWSIKEAKAPAGSKSSSLVGVACTSSEACITVGRYISSSSVEVPLAEKWTGSEWAIQEPKTPPGAKSSSLTGVSCTSPEACITVGRYINSSSVEVPLAEKWTGSEWAIQEPKTPPGAKSSSLTEVSCTSTEACTAVGHYVNGSSMEVPLAEHWNGTEWTIQTTANQKGATSSSLSGISCAVSEACTTVGHYVNDSNVEVPLAERWNGKEWAILTTATPEGAKSSRLLGVSCRTGETCVGAGNYGNGSSVESVMTESDTLHAPYVKTEPATGLTETGASFGGIVNPEGSETQYYFEYGTTTSYGFKTSEVNADAGTDNLEESEAVAGLVGGTEYHFRIVASSNAGTSYGTDKKFRTQQLVWSLQEPSIPTGSKESELRGISCTSSTSCVSVAYSKNSSGIRVPLAEGWNGTSWSVQEPPAPAEATLGILYGVSCTASNACTAVGYYEHEGQKGFAERWNGTTWSLQETVSPPEAKLTDLRGVSCTSSTYCVAVGFINRSSKNIPVAEKWKGTSWSAEELPIPTGATQGDLWGVSCSSTTACVAAGEFTNSSGVNVPLAETWNGTTWSVEEPSDPTEVTRSELEGVSCTSSTACTAVGFYAVKSGEWHPLAERWNGTTWSIQETPVIGKETYDLTAVSCTSSTACVAVGRFGNSSNDERSVAEVWNGTKWAAEEPEFPAPAGRLGELWGVSCVSSTVCMAGGFFETSSGEWRPSANYYHLQLVAWSLEEPSVPTGSKESELRGISCTSLISCVSVAYYKNGSGVRVPLAESWNGTSWSVQEPPVPAEATLGILYGVSCTASNACTAVGYYEHEGQKGFAERWNGTTWSLQETASPLEAKLTDLRGVSCVSSTYCMAVGFSNKSSKNIPVAEKWKGTSWSVEELPIPTGATQGDLWGVSCSSSSACVAAGEYTNSSGVNVPLAETWNGTTWSVEEPSDPTEVTRSELEGVSCTSSTACTAVGFYAVKSGEWRPLAERWNGTTWSIQEPPVIGKETYDLTAVSCTSPTACVAVGRFGNSSNDERSVAEVWNGTKWTAEEPEFPAGAGRLGELWGVSCVSSAVCMADGFFETSSGEWRPLAGYYQ